MAKTHVKKGDLVVVLSGEEKGRRGKVLEVLPAKGRVLIEGVNMIKKHTRKSQKDPQGGIISREGSLHISKVMKAEVYDQRAGRKNKAA